MYGLIGCLRAVSGRRDELASILVAQIKAMPGCRSYVIAPDAEDADAIWITEVWEDEAHHKASLGLPHVQATIQMARPLIAGFSTRVTTAPLGGVI
ncbi:putative quinol monooxygenase [Phenylobacterium aquaticum]|jgi:quinol monooxygenase YgiN|uniref:putative quinol monooxygenase n=1 Tax=Phenylobacterium aquaticum TaxID=1763816 RepID=UPI001F5D7BFA|nr:putative quinol monooxygenase [Phenylobacterium aquaticum]MCI3133902.1 antibiotic biosynthesis monooxygenase [Phenylobacterium aquaticum]